ncbi:MAG: hypothetical protein JO293_04100 [Candidatus Eremiobacteraeota bacterium]|nr:hypothetical protein [Candidatus Eremiobacteraeota bacterium]MBV8222516.1 hypothetical protein [Candidatus Eremiobacteraeota bacterium]
MLFEMPKNIEKPTKVLSRNGSNAPALPKGLKGKYEDGRAFDVVQYFDAKLILKPDFFDSVRGFSVFSDLVAEAASKVDKVKYKKFDLSNARPRIREVMFLDTADFRLYNNAFILRRRTAYQDGFPIADPEVVFKFRNGDLDKAQSTDVRPHIAGPYRIKLKAEALPLKDQVGGFRVLYAHNCIFPLSSVREPDRTSLKTIARVIPAVAGIIGESEERVELVNSTLVEEVLMDIGMLDFGKGLVAKANISLWRSLGDHHVMCGEFAYQTKFARREDVQSASRERVEDLFIKLQLIASGWLFLGTTKTGLVYRLKGNPPQAHE